MQTNLNQKVKIPKIKGKTLSLKESHQKAGVKEYRCSDFIPSLGLLAEGEYSNPESEKRNAKVVITDVRTGELKGKFLSHQNFSNSKGIAITGNKRNVYSVEFFMFNGVNYLGVSGDGGHFEVFGVSNLNIRTALSNFVCVF